MSDESVLTDDDQDQEPDPRQDKRNPLRDPLRNAEKERDALKARVAEFEKQAKETARLSAFTDAGLESAWAEFYPADAEATPEAVKAWAEQKKLAAGPIPSTTSSSAAPATLQPSPVAGSAPGANPSKLSIDDLDRLHRQGRDAEALDAISGDRVEMPRSPYDIYPH